MLINLITLKSMYLEDTTTRKANKSANQVVINAIDLVAQQNPTLKINVELSRGGNIPNRGETVEQLIKVWFKNSQQKTSRKSARGLDFYCNGVGYEVKCSTSKGYAHYNPSQNLDNLIFVDGSGIYLTSGDSIVLDKCGKHIKTITMKGSKQLLAW